MPIVAVAALGVGGFCMWNVHTASSPGPVIAVNGPQAPEQFTPKYLTYEIFGTPGRDGMAVYVDIDQHPHREQITTLPWSHTETTMLTVVSGSISAQNHGGTIGCRIRVNGVVLDEHSDDHQDSDVTCRVKSA